MDIEEKIVEEVKNEGTVVETSGTPKTEEIARESGWKPLEEWDGNPEEWVDAKTFNQRGEYLERIKTQSSQLKKLEKKLHSQEQTLKELADHHRKVAETERKRALDELKDLKKQALDIGDNERVVDIDDRIADLKQTKIEAPQQEQTQPGLHPELVEWIEDNPWYEKDSILRGAANGVVEEIITNNPELKGEVSRVLEMATNRLKEEFPNKFGKRRQAITESSSNEANKGSPSKNLARKLTEEQRGFAKRFIQQGALKSYEEYAQQLADIGELS